MASSAESPSTMHGGECLRPRLESQACEVRRQATQDSIAFVDDSYRLYLVFYDSVSECCFAHVAETTTATTTVEYSCCALSRSHYSVAPRYLFCTVLESKQETTQLNSSSPCTTRLRAAQSIQCNAFLCWLGLRSAVVFGLGCVVRLNVLVAEKSRNTTRALARALVART